MAKERKPLGEEKEKELLEFVKNNSFSKTAIHFDIGVDKLRGILKKYGVTRTEEDRKKLISKSSIRILTEEEEQSIINYYQNHSLKETALNFNYSEDWVQHFLHNKSLTRQGKERHNFIAETRKKNNREIHPIDDFKVIDFYTNHNTKTTCKKFHIQLEELFEILSRNNVDKRTREESKEMAKQTSLEKYGTLYPMQSKEIQNKKEQTYLEKYGVSLYWELSDAKRPKYSVYSKPNEKFRKLLQQHNIAIDKEEFYIKPRFYDFKVGDILIEINPSTTHNSTYNIFNSEPLDPLYHYNKTKLALDNGYKCICIWDWTDKEEILKILQSDFSLTQLDKPRRHLYNLKTKEHIISETEPLQKGWVEIFDDGVEIN